MYSLPLAGPSLAQETDLPPIPMPRPGIELDAPSAMAPTDADRSEEDELLMRLREAETPEQGARITNQIMTLWSKSGSATMDLLLRRGRNAAERQNWEAAIDHFSALVDHAPDFAEGYMGRALAFYNTERWGPAIADLEQVLALNPHHFGAMRGLATVMEQLGMEEEAHAAYGMALDLNPTDADAREARDRLELGLRGTSL
ncbi:tetratricopeptide repeat protein [Mesobacterium pallidum]|uniref:tetratricopeptide repeat protein n=1 Tax=Mesobacterium pallidum TaxID=2872037 RepID=UPI001EE1A6B8|nr:tetratricopeptide repeat protein [Mesobacterium pallidum]